jgi:hypothetical protein
MALSLKVGSKSRRFAAISQPVALNDKPRDSLESRGLRMYINEQSKQRLTLNHIREFLHQADQQCRLSIGL